jgi:hypothetical protein
MTTLPFSPFTIKKLPLGFTMLAFEPKILLGPPIL